MAYTQVQIRHLFQSQFDQSVWTDFIINFFKAQTLRRVPEPLDIDPSEGHGYYWGKLSTNDDYEISFFYLKMNHSVDKRKVGLRQLINRYIKIDSDAGIAVFDDGNHWRLSFITDMRGEKTAPKRYTFVFGDKEKLYNTAVGRFMDLQKAGISFKNIKEAFSVEALTRDFYNDLFDWYTWALDPSTGVYFPNNPNTNADDTKQLDTKLIRLITRLMFVWFIKQKGLVPANLFDPEEIKLYLKDFDENSMEQSNYYQAILQNLFFATLNRPIKNITYDKDGNEIVERRCFATNKDKPDVKSKYRYTELFKISEDRILKLFEFIPFINGGLFECLDKNKTSDGVEQAYYDDGFSRNDTMRDGHFTKRAFVPNKLFFDPNDGIISIFNRYNFTVEENSPSEQQVALDPELLGKVFENLLGVYNPETHDTARSQSGSFYTPREIVNYMVDISLQSYLGNTDEVKALFADDFEYDERKKEFYADVIKKLQTIKVLDPACGSGAFPMGMLNRIIELLQNLKATGSKYDLKLQIMENCIYGGDIQTIAAQITKLRFFISLVCDCEKTNNPDDNYGIPNLPNLETHFVTCNSLVGLKKPQQYSLFEQDVIALKEKLQEVRHEHFVAKTVYQKTKLRNRDKELRDELAKMLSDDNVIASEDAAQMVAWNPYDQNGQSAFFDPEWMFGIKDGFDVVIGNPPYISTKDVTPEDKKRYESQYGFSDDTYNLFTLRSLGCTYKGKRNDFTVNSLVSENGSLAFIIPKTFWTTQTKRFMRDVILGKQINVIYDTANPFEAVMVDTCIIQVQNNKYDPNHEICVLDGHENLLKPIVLPPIKQSLYINAQNSVIFKPSDLNLKINDLYGQKVKELYQKWWDKIETSKEIAKNHCALEAYRASLKPGDITLLGCLTEGGQGLATANNGKYLAVRRSTKWANIIISTRPMKLADVIKKYRVKIPKMEGFIDTKSFLNTLSEMEIALLFEDLKEKYGRDIFGKGYIYKIIEDSELANVDELTQDEKENGIDSSKNYYVPYDKGDKDGNRWYLETPYAIAWSKENVQFLKTDPKARYQGYTFYFREGFCWIDVNSTFLKARIKANGVFDVLSMSLFTMTQLPDWYFVCMINSEIISLYVDNFINNTSHFQINDARQLPIIIPDEEQLNECKVIFDKSVELKKKQFQTTDPDTIDALETELNEWQKKLDAFVLKLYGLE